MAKISKEKRSYIMSQIRGKNNKVELLLRKALWKHGVRYRLHYKIKGSPDIVFPKQRLVIFCDGDFWHGYGWDKLKKRLKGYWYNKVKENIRRDRKIDRILRKEGWQLIHVWEHEIRKGTEKCIKKIIRKLDKLNNSASKA